MSKQEALTLLEWQEQFSTEEACQRHLIDMRWPEGFVCPHCQHEGGWFIAGHNWFECKACHRHTSPTSGTVFHATKLPLRHWFTALYFVGVDKGGISAERLRKYIDVSWNTANLMLQKLRAAMKERDVGYLLKGVIELDDAFVGGRDTGGKRGRGSETKTKILVACEQRNGGKSAGFLKMSVVPAHDEANAKAFSNEAIAPQQTLKTDGSKALQTLSSHHTVTSKVSPPADTPKWLPWVHIAIANLKRFLLGTFHGVSGHRLQAYLDEFCYRFNRRWFELEIPNRLLAQLLNHPPLTRTSLSL